jgi:hypothetical protein
MQEDYLSHMKLETEGREIARFFRTDERNLKATKGFFFFALCEAIKSSVPQFNWQSLLWFYLCGTFL